MDALASFSS